MIKQKIVWWLLFNSLLFTAIAAMYVLGINQLMQDASELSDTVAIATLVFWLALSVVLTKVTNYLLANPTENQNPRPPATPSATL